MWSTDPEPVCPTCGGSLDESYGQGGKSATVIGDEMDLMVPHGVCHDDGSPKRFTSKSALRAELKAAGLEPFVRHMPPKGSDKSKFTTRWGEPPSVLTPEDEERRIANWHAFAATTARRDTGTNGSVAQGRAPDL